MIRVLPLYNPDVLARRGLGSGSKNIIYHSFTADIPPKPIELNEKNL